MMRRMAAEHPEIDLANPDTFVEGVPYDWFDHLRPSTRSSGIRSGRRTRASGR